MAANSHSLDLESSSSQAATANDSVSLSQTGNMTFEAWVRFETLPSGAFMGIGTKWDNSTSQKSYGFDISDTAGQKKITMVTSSDGSGLSVASVNVSLSTATWYHIAWIYDAAAGSFEAVLNGVSQGTGTGLNTSVFNGNKAFSLGAIDGADYFDGMIDEARLWSAKRTVAEILANKEKDVTGQANLAAYWKLNNALTDSSGNNNTLTGVNSPVFSTTVPFANYAEDFASQAIWFM